MSKPSSHFSVFPKESQYLHTFLIKSLLAVISQIDQMKGDLRKKKSKETKITTYTDISREKQEETVTQITVKKTQFVY